MPFESIEFLLPGQPIETIHRETASVEMTATLFINIKTDYRAYLNESATVDVESTVTLPPVGILPI